ncbi:diaminopimelate decarboxylase-like [Planococcus citri]|uniref:Diaminopimelate decarboxylase n=1 Tax=Planococcus citri TaxID=170843 RepID=S5N928_9HEMI|nr:diaminopimelate decarboxylase [Planococcus citri]
MAFTYRDNELYIEDVKVDEIAKKINTPTYCYSLKTIRDNFNSFYQSLPGFLICFAVKSNSNLSILKIIGQLGGGADVVSEGEIRLALAAGIPPEKIVFSGVGKTASEIRYALTVKVHQLNFESIEELKQINTIASDMGTCAMVVARLSPDIDAKTNYKISTGLYKNKFGIPMEILEKIDFKTLPNVKLCGVSAHIGSQICSLEIFLKLVNYMKDARVKLNSLGHNIRRIDLGGGLGVSYAHNKEAPPIAEYAKLLRDNLSGLDCEFICEPGRSIIANTAVLLSQVLYRKSNDFVSHVIIDAGMNDFVRPAVYGSLHQIIPAKKDPSLPIETVDIVGPVCETSDTFAKDYSIQRLKNGDLVCVCDVGAYGGSMCNTYNSRLLPAEVLINGNRISVIRNRGNYEDLLKQTIICDGIDQ